MRSRCGGQTGLRQSVMDSGILHQPDQLGSVSSLLNVSSDQVDHTAYEAIGTSEQTLWTPTSNVFPSDRVDHKAYEGTGAAEQTLWRPHVLSSAPNDVSPFKFSVSRLPHWAQEKVSHATKEKDDNEFEASFFKSSDSRWAERLGREGYKLFSENHYEGMPPATIRASGFGIRRRFTIESADYQDRMPESSLGSQPCATTASSPKGASKETQWKTVHTVLFHDEHASFQDNGFLAKSPLATVVENEEASKKQSLAEQERKAGTLSNLQNDTDEDSIVVYLSEDEQEVENQEHCFVEKKSYDERLVDNSNVGNRFEYMNEVHASQEGCSETLNVKTDDLQRCKESMLSMILPVNESSEDDDDNEEDFTPQRDLFATHFDKLSTAMKGPTSARSSFSTRFFARCSDSAPRMTLFENPPAIAMASVSEHPFNNDNITKSLLATERERLKLRERQDRMAVEVQLMRDRLFHLGVTALETSSCGEGRKNHQDEEKNKSLPDVGQECNYTFAMGFMSDSSQGQWEQGHAIANYDLRRGEPASVADEEIHVLDSSETRQVIVDFEAQYACCKTTVAAHPLESCVSEAALDEPARDDAAKELIEKTAEQRRLNASLSGSMNDPLNLQSTMEMVDPGTHELGQEPHSSEEPCMGILSSVSNQHDMLEELDGCSMKQPEPELPDVLHATCLKDVAGDIVQVPEQDFIKLIPCSSEFPRSMEHYKSALHNLAEAADKALVLFKEYQSLERVSQDALFPDLSGLFQEFIPFTYQKVQELSDCLSSVGRSNDFVSPCESLDNFSQRTSNNGTSQLSHSQGSSIFQSRPGTAPSQARTESLLESVDIESFVQRYSLRFSESLASQVLALVQKGLDSQSQGSNL